MKRIGVFVDVSNIYYCVQRAYNKRKLDYRKYLEYVASLGEVKRAIAYGCQIRDEAKGFIQCLEYAGFETKFKGVKSYREEAGLRRKADWDVGIAIDIVRLVENLDIVILGTADGDLVPVVEWCIERGIKVIVFACGVSKDLKETATEFFEIPESLLEIK